MPTKIPSKKKYSKPALGKKKLAKRYLHGLRWSHSVDPFYALQDIVAAGFTGGYSPNVIRMRRQPNNVLLAWSDASTSVATFGDKYGIAFLAHDLPKSSQMVRGGAFLKSAAPRQIEEVRIKLNRKISGQERQKRIKFYKRLLPGYRVTFV